MTAERFLIGQATFRARPARSAAEGILTPPLRRPQVSVEVSHRRSIGWQALMRWRRGDADIPSCRPPVKHWVTTYYGQ